MGTWGVGLYQDDDAADLKPLLGVLLGLPIELDEVIKLSRGEGVVFWLVLADQLERKGLRHGPTYQTAISILENGADIERLRHLEMSEANLIKRAKVNDDLLTRLKNPRPEKPRKTLKKPKPLPVQTGDIVIYPSDTRSAVNPYFSPKLLEKAPFTPTGWGAFMVADTGFAFDFLPWIGIRRLGQFHATQPDLGTMNDMPLAQVVGYGTLSPSHFKKMNMQVIGQRIETGALPPLPYGHADGPQCALQDISISNRLFNQT